MGPPLTSLGRRLPTAAGAFGELRRSNDILGDPAAQRERLATDGYLYFKKILPEDLVLEARRSIIDRLRAEDLLDPARDPSDGIVNPRHLENMPTDADAGSALKRMKANAFRPDLARSNAAIERVVYGPELQAFYDALFGEPALHFDFTWLRVMGPGHGTPAHCDKVYMGRGSEDLLTCWVPYGDVPLNVGGLILLEGSHHASPRIAAYLARDVDAYCVNRPEEVRRVAGEGRWSFPGWLSHRPDTLGEKFRARWLTSSRWEIGDFITFPMSMIHGSLDNASDRVRISTDVRYQPASHPADERWIGANPPGHGLAGKRGRIC